MKPTRTFTDPLNRELELRMRQRLAALPRHAAEPMEGEPVVPEKPLPVAEDGVSSENLALQQLQPLYEQLLKEHNSIGYFSSELTRRKLTENQLRDFSAAENWLTVTKGIAKQYAEALVRLEQLLEQLTEGVTEFRAAFGKDPPFLSNE